ncbi:NAD(P)H-quinone oxidoreductase subunit N, chloroplastic [Hordeum vulgare]|uniref:NAD(P)H-quinone oxidoreductase subunit N n=1 Tax=Hordeum vulgare subsp. spontaneum TaxID=77009 RepID=UPI001E281C35|nr:NAD(P)H-quinone oxidoreductase subunit N, chloroplastic [Hordeum vulgare]7EU3_N Chain N, NAD(P)H-quinone oxidoreductase subunit N [Hordeum vulgare subsp. spontaneum]7F9O_Y Chain Y, NAD(P)H-quinone oxidoreductase subunit N, chloroplastic [Hordeum vulgare subsp. spontaneum]
MWSGAAAAVAARSVSPPLHAPTSLTGRRGAGRPSTVSVRAGGGLMDFVGGDLVKPDLGRWLDDVEKHKALAIYPPHEGGYEGRYLNRLRYQGYYFLDLSARGLGDPESTLTKIHPVCPPSLGRQPVARWYFPPEVDYRLSLLHPDAKGLIVWVYEAKVSFRLSLAALTLNFLIVFPCSFRLQVLSKAELQFLAMLPDLRPKVRVIAECGNWRKFIWKPLKQISGLEPDPDAEE